MAMKRCPVCGERYSDTYKNCPFCEEEEYWEEEQDTRRPILREGGRSSSRSKSAYGVVTPILIVLIVLMAALLIYLLYGDKIGGMFAKDPEDGRPGVQDGADPVTPDTGLSGTGTDEPGTDPSGPDDAEADPSPDSEGGDMPEGSGDGSSGDGSDNGSEGSGGMSYASAAALPGGLTLSRTDFSRKVSEGGWQLRVSGGTGTYTWISEDPSIATVSSDGTVTPVSSGTTNVVVTDGSKKAICIVRVSGGGSATPSTPSSTPSTTPSTTPAPSTGGGTLRAGSAVVVNGGNGVRVRSGPGTEYEALATIPNGGSVQIQASAGNDWYQVTFTASGGVTTTGYMKGEFLSNS